MTRTLYIRHVPDDVAERLEQLASRAGLPLSTFALQELSETARRADNAVLLQAPDLIDAEVLSMLSRLVLAGRSDSKPAARTASPCQPPPVANLTAYDALDVALAERLGATLLTADARAARAPELRCSVELMPP